MIEVDRVTKSYGPFTAVSELSFSVGSGEILGLLGPNGAGKTTTMRMLTGFFPPTTGAARIAGHDIVAESRDAKRKTGYLPETPPLYPEMSVSDYLDFVARIKGVPSKRRRQRVEHVTERCDLGDVRDTLSAKLSKGYRQRVGLAQALIHEPEVLILDEPTAGLDPKQIGETRNLIKTLGGDHTIVLSTHILPEVAATCDRVVIINQGKLVAHGTPEALTEQFHQATTLHVTVEGPRDDIHEVIGDTDGVARFEELSNGSESSSTWLIETAEGADVRRALSERIVERGLGLLELRAKGMSLEDVYLRAISGEHS